MVNFEAGDPEYGGSCRLIVDGAEVSTGTMNIYYFLRTSSGNEWLDTDLSSLTATRTAISCSYDSDIGFFHALDDPPSSLVGENVSWEMEHSVYGFVASGSFSVGVGDSGSSSRVDVKLQG